MAYAIEELLEAVIDNGASDLHVNVGRAPCLRLKGSVIAIDGPVLTEQDAEALVRAITPESHLRRLIADGGCDYAYAFQGKARLRVSAYRGRSGWGMVLRLIPSRMLTFDQLRLPPVIKDVLRRARGLVLVTGPTGSGKSTTLASMINWINENEEGHIITIEDPVEYTHVHKNCLITQREVHTDLPSFAEGVRAALRQDPDVILIGEMRDLETIEAAVTAAETGHLVLGTLHTSGAASTVDRIIDAFPEGVRDQIRMQLSSSLTAVISQCLLHTIDDRRAAASEVMIKTDAIAAKIRDGKTFQIQTDLETGASRGMRTLDSDLLSLYLQGVVSAEEVLSYCREPEAMRQRMQAGANQP